MITKYMLDGEEETTDAPAEESKPEEEATPETAQTKTCSC